MNMLRLCILLIALFSIAPAHAETKAKSSKEDEKEVSGMSIVGNNETPKSLVIIPWKSSEIGQENKLKSNLMNDSLTPVDQAVFMRELEFYNLSNSR